MEVLIIGDKWKIIIMEEDAFVRRFGNDTAAITILEDRKIYFHHNDFTKEIIRHEIYHAALFQTCTESASLTNDQFEEVACDVFGRFGPRLNRLANLIYKELKE